MTVQGVVRSVVIMCICDEYDNAFERWRMGTGKNWMGCLFLKLEA